MTIADSGGTILARVPLPERFVGTVIPDDFQRLIHADQPGVLEVTSQDGTDRVLGYRPIAPGGSPLYVSAGFSKAEAFAPINRATIMNVAAIAGGALVAFLAALFIGNRFLLSPIASIANVMDRWRAGELSARTKMKPSDEVHAVGASLDALLDELDCRRAQNVRADEERTLLVRELAHRVKNGFALVQAIARQSFAKADPGAYHSFAERLSSLASTYDLLLSKDATASTVREVVATALHAHSGADGERIHIEGPEVVLPADLALPLSLVVHELATNATKYGSLGSELGLVSIDWTKDGDRVIVTWKETGGPLVSPPTRKGFGSVLIERAFPSKALGRFKSDYRPEGLVFEIGFSVEQGAQGAGFTAVKEIT